MSLEHLNIQEPPIKGWSYSKLKNFEKCPYRIFLSGVKKEPYPPQDESAPNVRGEKIHKEAEQFIKGEVNTLPASLKKFKDEFIRLREDYQEGTVKIEDEWAFDEEWTVIHDWWGKNVWLRVKTDVIEFFDNTAAVIIDWKTGKRFGNEVPHTQQGQLYAIAAFMRYPQLDAVEVQFAYLDEGKTTKKIYRRDQVAAFLTRFLERAQKLTTCVSFQPKPNIHNCQWCPYGPEKGTNVCTYGVNR